ncbi:hypothetical protein [Bacillus cereus group sp. IBL03679]|uniref:hypothetical protein n=1 Tax=Bacillus cereus group sp. IBL03679 TaxID=3240095 RepID=UPI003D2F52AE
MMVYIVIQTIYRESEIVAIFKEEEDASNYIVNLNDSKKLKKHPESEYEYYIEAHEVK